MLRIAKKVGAALQRVTRSVSLRVCAVVLGLCSSALTASAQEQASKYNFDVAGTEMGELATALKTFITGTALTHIITVVGAVLAIVILFRAIRWCLGALNI